MKFLKQSELEHAQKLTQSNMAAAKLLNLSFNTYKKYAKMYYNEQGISLYEAHKNQFSVGIKRVPSMRNKSWAPLEDILQNKYPGYPLQVLKLRLIKSGLIKEECAICGFEEKRLKDYKSPLLLTFKDGNSSNFSLTNLELLCYNHYFLVIGNIIRNKNDFKKYYGDDTTK